MLYEIGQKFATAYASEYFVEAVGDDGEVYVTVFSGPNAKERAEEYANWKNGVTTDA